MIGDDRECGHLGSGSRSSEKHIAVGFDYSLLDDFLNTWKKKKEDLASGKITKEEYFEWKINWPHAED